MSRHNSEDIQSRQAEFWNFSDFSTRLRAERQRLGLNQKGFGALANVTLDSQNRYENAKNVPSAEYLGRLAGHGVDVCYVLTGERTKATRLDRSVNELVNDFALLPAPMKNIAIATVRAMREEVARPTEEARTLHSPTLTFRAEKSGP